MSRFEPDEQVNMIRHATDTLRNPTQTTHGTAHVFMQPRPPFRSDPRFAIFCREDDVVQEIGMSRGHAVNGLHPVRGACFVGFVIRWYRFAP